MNNNIRNKNVIYIKIPAGTIPLSFPYPPVFQEKQTDYLCFTDDQNITSKFWKICYVSDCSDIQISDSLSAYENCMEILPNQVIIGPLFEQASEYEAVVSIPGLHEIPGVSFDQNKMVPTKDKSGNYLHTKNPVYTGGPYHGRPLLLTIGVPVSNQIETIERCLSHVKPLLEQLASELLVIDTGSTDGTLDVCKSYGAKIIRFPWCNNMSAVRNTGIYHAQGDWYLSIDDDEWFEDVEDILSFFQSGEYLKHDAATYIQRNYNTSSGETWSDNHTLRMAKITPELHFEGRIHDALIVPMEKKPYQIFSYAHHYGFIKDILEKREAKYARNVSHLLYDIYEYPTSLRYNYQLSQELNAVENYALAYAFLLRGISIEKEVSDSYYGKNHASFLLATLYNAKNPSLFPLAKLVENSYPYTLSEKAFFAYIQAALGLELEKETEKILGFYHNYLTLKEQFQKNPNDSLLFSTVGLEVCTNIQYLTDAHVIAFCAYSRNGQTAKALGKLKEIDYETVLNEKESLIQCFLNASDELYQPCTMKLSPTIAEFWSSELLSALLESLKSEEIQQRQLKRLSYYLRYFSIDALNRFFFRFGLVSDTNIQEVLWNFAMTLKEEEASIQELFFYSFLLRCRFVKTAEPDRRMEFFIKYSYLTGAFAAAYYQCDLLEKTNHCVIPRDILAAYHIYLALEAKDTTSIAVSHLKTALDVFPGFRNEIQNLLDEITQPKHDSVMDELAALTAQIKRNAKGLIEAGRTAEAVRILQELQGYMPQDEEVRELLEMLEG